ncbi:hypothetical protein CJ030_MR1G020588 [Morella rubra]|uniref:Apple domain-containing protein n=1 Tax=Morella rubra TaxID=262757 RepID=A0A6A1WMB1_9ROSI|nr:hypothetical protein CJ030_MR1G020588 [Morella rubra]
MTMEACRQLCLQDCSCTTYASMDAREKARCMNWKVDLIETRVYEDGGQNLYVRVDALELGREKQPTLFNDCIVSSTSKHDESRQKPNLPFFDLSTIVATTDNFLLAKRLGQGGFGPVYKETIRQFLDWRKRFEIITGIARGVLYLHQDSRIKIIHIDLKANLNPKLFQVWDLWMEGKALDIVDSTLSVEFTAHEVSRCIQIGLLCVQEQATDRPTMLDVLFMLGNETTISSPNKPAFNKRRTISPTPDSSGSAEAPASLNEMTISAPEAR